MNDPTAHGLPVIEEGKLDYYRDITFFFPMFNACTIFLFQV